MRILTALALVSVATVAIAGSQTPTPADGTVSVLASNAQAQPVAPVATEAPVCCQTEAKEVRLGPWQARRLSKQADRQEARDCRDCCKCNCKDERKPTALVLTRKRPACNCCK